MAVTKIIELVGSSTESSDDAVRQALEEARKTLRNIKAVHGVSTGLGGHGPGEWGLTSPELAERVGFGRRHMSLLLLRLEEHGLVVHEGRRWFAGPETEDLLTR